MRTPDHGRPYDYGGRKHKPASAPSPSVHPSPNEQSVALYGPDGKPLRYTPRRPIGYRSLRNETE